MEARRGIVRVSRHGVAAAKERGAVVRPSQLIASVRRTFELGGRMTGPFGMTIGMILLAATASASGVQLFNIDVLGKPTSEPVKLLADRVAGDAEPFVVWTDVSCGEYVAASVFYREPVTLHAVRTAVNKTYGAFEMPASKAPVAVLWRITEPGMLPSAGREPGRPQRVLAIQLTKADDETVRLIYMFTQDAPCTTEK